MKFKNYIGYSPFTVFVLSGLFVVGLERNNETLVIISLLLTACCLFFYRSEDIPFIEDPLPLILNIDPNKIVTIVSPVEGQIIDIITSNDNQTTTVSIQPSFLDRHVQIMPITGNVNTVNIKTTVVNYTGKNSKDVQFSVIVGSNGNSVRFVKNGDTLNKGSPFGFLYGNTTVTISFPSQFTLMIQKGQYIKLGQTIALTTS